MTIESQTIILSTITRPPHRYRFIEAQRDHYPVRLLCQLVEVPASGYYAWQETQQQAETKPEPAWETALVKVFGVHNGRGCCKNTIGCLLVSC